jgi:hypothetical protein
MTRRRKVLATVFTTLAAGGLAVAPAAPASASGGCSGSLIRINTNPGAEPPSWAYGHRHRTGNHYIRYRSGSYLIWWADNNGGLDGDTRDTYHTTTYCP